MSSDRGISTYRTGSAVAIVLAVGLVVWLVVEFTPARAVLAFTSLASSALILASTAFDRAIQRNILLSAKSFFLFGFFVFMVVGMLKNVWIYDYPVVTSLDTIVKASASVFVALLVFLLAYYLPSLGDLTRRSADLGTWIPGDREKRRLFYLAALTFLLGAAGLLLYNPLEGPDAVAESGSFARSFVYFSIVSGIVCFYLWMHCRNDKTRWMGVVLLILLLIDIGISVFRASRYVNMYLYIFMFIYYFYHRRYVLGLAFGLKQKIMLVAFPLALFFVGSFTKTLMLTGWQLDSNSDTSVAQELAVRVGMLDFIDAFDNLCFIIERYATRGDYQFGWTLLVPFVNPFPRELWAGKPQAFGAVMAGDLYPDMPGLSLAPSLAGELIANGGYLLMAFGFFLAGRLAKYVDWRIGRSVGESHRMLWAIPLLYLFAMENRGDFLLNTEFFYIILQLYLISLLAKSRRIVLAPVSRMRA